MVVGGMSCGQRMIARHDWKTVVMVGLASIDTLLALLKMKLSTILRQEGSVKDLFNLTKGMEMSNYLKMHRKKYNILKAPSRVFDHKWHCRAMF